MHETYNFKYFGINTEEKTGSNNYIISHKTYASTPKINEISIYTSEYIIGNTTNNISPEIYAFDCHLYLLSMMRKQSFVHLNIRAMRPTLD